MDIYMVKGKKNGPGKESLIISIGISLNFYKYDFIYKIKEKLLSFIHMFYGRTGLIINIK